MKIKKILILILSILLFLGLSFLEEVSSKLNDRIIELFSQGKYEQVIQLTRWKQWTKDKDVIGLRIIALLKLGKGQDAEREMMSISKNPPLIIDHIYYLYLEYLAQRGEVTKMPFWLKTMEKESPTSILLPRAYLLTARAFLKENHSQKAISLAARVLTISTSSDDKQEVLLLLSQALTKLNYFQETIWMLQKIYRDFPQRAAEIKSLLQPIVTQIDLRNLSPEAQIATLEFLSTIGLYDDTERLIDQVGDDTLPLPLWRRFFVLQARIALYSGNLTKLENILQKAKKQSEEEVLFYWGVLEQRKARYPQAIQNYRKVVQLFPQGKYAFQAYQNIAFCYRTWGKEKEYLDTLNQLISLFPQETSPWWELFRFFYERNQRSQARELMKKLATVNKEEKNRALFWLYKLGNPFGEKRYLEEILKSGDIDYYYVRAWQELKKLERHSPSIPLSENKPEFNVDAAIFTSLSWRKYWFLQNIHLWENAEMELLSLYRNHHASLYLYLELSSFYERKGDYRKSILYALYLRNRMQENHPELFKRIETRIYPQYFLDLVKQLSSPQKFDPYLFLSLVRAESSFQVDAVSSAGAVGLAQLLPSTALWIIEKGWAKFEGENIPSENDTNALTHFLIRPEVNLSLGVAYFTYLLDRFQGNLYFAICAYNAGPGRMDRWKEELPSKDLDAFVEFIPFRETQNYLRRIITNYFFYSILYRGDFPQEF
ncbi:MAG: transglycosylase SLT domain-containing protein [Candidatus Atribacteria bacterium]|nr:transglycosylase SLT domain-containing protein [Candidatus Atribacteria bacterium]